MEAWCLQETCSHFAGSQDRVYVGLSVGAWGICIPPLEIPESACLCGRKVGAKC